MWIFLTALVAMVGGILPAHAFTVEPTQSHIESPPGAMSSSTLLLVNDESRAQLYTFSVHAFTSHGGGIPEFVPMPDVESWFVVPTSTLVVEAGGKASIPYFFRPPLDATPGGYSVAVFAEARAQDGGAMRMIPSVGTLVFATVEGEVDTTFYVDSEMRHFAWRWPIAGQFRVDNRGKGYVVGDVSMRIHPLIGEDDVRMIASSTTVLPGTERMYEHVIERRGVWRILPMLYTVEWTLSSDDRDVVDSSRVLVVPWYSVAVIACFGLFAYTKRKRYVA